MEMEMPDRLSGTHQQVMWLGCSNKKGSGNVRRRRRVSRRTVKGRKLERIFHFIDLIFAQWMGNFHFANKLLRFHIQFDIIETSKRLVGRSAPRMVVTWRTLQVEGLLAGLQRGISRRSSSSSNNHDDEFFILNYANKLNAFDSSTVCRADIDNFKRNLRYPLLYIYEASMHSQSDTDGASRQAGRLMLTRGIPAIYAPCAVE